MSCSFDRELLALYSSGDLTPTESEQVQSHVDECGECATALQNYRTALTSLSTAYREIKPSTKHRPSYQRTPALRRFAMAAAIAALATGTVVAVPQARAQVGQLFNSYSYRVRTEEETPLVTVIRNDGTIEKVKESGNVVFDRQPVTPPEGGQLVRDTTTSLTTAKTFLGHGVALPPSLDGQHLTLYRTTDKQSNVVETGLSSTSGTGPEFWAVYRADGVVPKVHATYSYDWDVKVEKLTITGHQAILVTAMQPGGKGTVDLWIENGNWTYQLAGYHNHLDQVLEIAQSIP